jgi:glucose/mannose-6-phosphate isomerase
MLDDLKYIHEKDAQDALGVAEKQWQQYKHDFKFQWQPPRMTPEIVVAGMGGSGLAAKVIKSWPGVPANYEVVQEYDLPEYANQFTLLVCSSYSGNTEEILSVLDRAMARPEDIRPMIVVVASGGKLLEAAQAHDLPHIQLPGGLQPRMTLGYQMRALLEIFEQSGKLTGALGQLDDAADWLKDQMSDWLPQVPTAKNPAKQLAQELMGKSPVIYAGPKLFPAAYKWKISFNENAKNVAWCSQIPEFNHNEFLGWTSHPTEKPYAIVDLRSNLEHERVQKRFEVSDRLLSGKRPAAHVVNAEGDTLLKQLLWTIAFGDFVTLYVALLNGLNPTPVELIEKLKKELAG